MGFDFTILVFTAVALLGRPSAKTGLWRMLFQDGLVYFLISFTMNCIPAVSPLFFSEIRDTLIPHSQVFNILDLNRKSIAIVLVSRLEIDRIFSDQHP
jgi:hypothetical protein